MPHHPRPVVLAATGGALLLLALGALAAPAAAAATTDDPADDAPAAGDLAIAVDFLAGSPRIDGTLDARLATLPRRRFVQVLRDDTEIDPPAAHYRLAYGTAFLYVYVEVAGDQLFCRDRAYQNGDGLQLVISRVMPGGAPSEEFHVLACSAVDRPQMEWSRRIFWYRDVDHLFQPVSDGTLLATDVGGGTVRFELLLPWADVHPRHPWLGDGVGLDLALCKGAADGGLTYHVARPYTRYLGAENQPRETTPLVFAPPALPAGAAPQTFVQLARAHATPAEPVAVHAVTAAAARLDAGGSSLAPGSRTMLNFRARELADQLAGKPAHETAGAERLALARLLDDLAAAEHGHDPVAARHGLQRRAYRSALDGSLQPYMVHVPDGLAPDRRHPLLVYLHGSASDETDLAGVRFLDPGGCIMMAPRGLPGPSRGTTPLDDPAGRPRRMIAPDDRTG